MRVSIDIKAVVRGHHFGLVASGVYAELSSTPGSTLQCYTMGMVERILGLFFFFLAGDRPWSVWDPSSPPTD